MSNSESVVYKGITFRRYPDSERWADRVYFNPGTGDRQRGVDRLHREIWKATYGDIPDGYHVHHKDENPLNNEPDNLVCLPGEDHMAQHAPPLGVFPPQLAATHSEALAKAAEWHRSEKGREWHRGHAYRQGFGSVEPQSRSCAWCGHNYDDRQPSGRGRFCSNNCKTKHRKASGVDDEDRTCIECGAGFRTNRYTKVRCCTRSCAMRRSRRERKRLQPDS